jgi:hypothetical protein
LFICRGLCVVVVCVLCFSVVVLRGNLWGSGFSSEVFVFFVMCDLLRETAATQGGGGYSHWSVNDNDS